MPGISALTLINFGNYEDVAKNSGLRKQKIIIGTILIKSSIQIKQRHDKTELSS